MAVAKYYAKYLKGKDYIVNSIVIRDKKTETTKEINDYLKSNKDFELEGSTNSGKGKA